MTGKKIRWSKRATIQINKVYDYIERDSPLSAQRMYEKLAAQLIPLSKDPLINPPDKYKTMNDGSYRAFTLSRYRIRIAYRVCKKEIVILHVRHTKRKVKFY